MPQSRICGAVARPAVCRAVRQIAGQRGMNWPATGKANLAGRFHCQPTFATGAAPSIDLRPLFDWAIYRFMRPTACHHRAAPIGRHRQEILSATRTGATAPSPAAVTDGDFRYGQGMAPDRYDRAPDARTLAATVSVEPDASGSASDRRLTAHQITDGKALASFPMTAPGWSWM